MTDTPPSEPTDTDPTATEAIAPAPRRGRVREAIARLDPQDRPLPATGSLIGAAAGVLLFASLLTYLEELGDADHQRTIGLALSLGYLLVGVLLMVFNRDRRAMSAGVALSALALGPALIFVFIDVDNPEKTFDRLSDATRVQTEILAVGFVVYLLAYLVGPGRRHALFLGLALLSLWSIANTQIMGDWLESAVPFADAPFSSVGTSSGSVTYGPNGSFDEGSFDEGSFDEGSFDEGSFDEGSSGDGFTIDVSDEGEFREPDSPAGKLGAAGVGFGLAYLLLAAWRDRKGDARMATPCYAVGLPITTLGVLYLGDPLHAWGASLLGLTLAILALRFALPGHRRFSTWYATAAAVVALFAFVGNGLQDSARAAGTVFAVLGVVLVVVAGLIDPPTPKPVTAGAGDGPPEGDGSGWEGTAPGSASAPTHDPWRPATQAPADPAGPTIGPPTLEPPPPNPFDLPPSRDDVGGTTPGGSPLPESPPEGPGPSEPPPSPAV